MFESTGCYDDISVDPVVIVTDSEEDDNTRDPMRNKKCKGFKAPSPARMGRTMGISGPNPTPRKKRTSVVSPHQLSPTLKHAQPRRLSSEEIINEMEKEQDAIVMRLLREIDQLREENSRLRKNLGAAYGGDPQPAVSASLSRHSSISSGSSSVGSVSSGGTGVSATRSLNSGALTPLSSRRPSSATHIDTLTPTLLLQRKRNSLSSVSTVSSKKSDELSDYNLSSVNVPGHHSDTSIDSNESCSNRRRRSSARSPDNSKKLQRSIN